MRNKKLLVIVIYNGLIAMLFAIPRSSLPEFINIINLPSYAIGFLPAAEAISAFIFSPMIGRKSDIIGRKKFILATPICYTTLHLIFSFTYLPILLIICKFIMGIFIAITVSLHSAYIGDVTPIKDRAKAMGLLTLSGTIGASFGTIAGGQLGEINIKYPFFAQFFLGIIVFFVMIFFIKEPIRRNNLKNTVSKKIKSSIHNYKGTILIFLLFNIAAITFSLNLFNTTLIYYLKNDFLMSPSTIGLITGITSFSGMLIGFCIISYLTSKYSENHIFKYTLLFFSFSIFGLFLFKTIILTIFIILICMIMFKIYFPIHRSIISKLSINNDLGAVMGLRNSAQCIGNIVSSISMGFLFTTNSTLPFIISSLVLFIVFLIFNISKKYNSKEFSDQL